MYEIQLDMFGDFDNYDNPIFKCKNLDELISIMHFFMRNDYDVLIRKVD